MHKSHLHRAHSVFASTYFWLLLATCWAPISALNADTFEWTGGAGTSNWNDAGNWNNTTAVTTDADGIPDLDDTARFTANAMAAGGSADNLTVLAGVDVEVGNDGNTSSITVGSTITNSGEIGFQADNGGNNDGFGGADQAIIVNSDVTLTGGGTIRFNGAESGIRGTSNTGGLTNVDNTIRGAGTIGSTVRTFALNNQGTIVAEGGTLSLIGTTLDNTGVLGATSDGTLLMNQSTLDGGSFSVVGFGKGRLTGNTLADGTVFTGNGQIEINNARLRDATIQTNSLTVGGGNTSTATLEGTITNSGEIGFQEDDGSNGDGFGGADQAIIVNSDVTLTGGGTIRFNGAESGIRGTSNTGGLTNVDNTIRGAGTIGSTVRTFALNNQGTIVAEGGTLSLIGTTLDNTNGLINIASDGLLTASSSTISGGVLDGDVGARFSGSSLADIETTGVIVLGSGGNTSSTNLEGTITNSGEIGFQADNGGNNDGFGGADQAIIVNSDVTLTGEGTIRFNGAESGIRGTSNTGGLTNVDNTIRGAGTIGSTVRTFALNNQGTIVAEGGTLSLIGTTLDNTGVLGATSDGTLLMNQSTLDGGSFSVVGFGKGSLTGNTLADGTVFTGNGQIEINNARLRDATIQTNSLTVGGGNTSTATLEGTITNSGEIGFQADNGGNNDGFGGADQAIIVNSDVTLTGGGTIRFNGAESGIRGTSNTGGLTNVDNTIRGAGTIGSTVRTFALNNQGTIVAEGGTLSLIGTTLDNTNGLINIASDGLLTASSSTISGGILDGDVGARFSGSSLADIETTGVIVLGSGGNTSSTTLEGTITNSGEIGFQADNGGNNDGFGGADQAIIVNSDVTLTGEGTIRFNGAESGIRGTSNTGGLTNVDNIIRGAGTIGSTSRTFALNNQGTIVAEGGTLSLIGTTLDNTNGLMNVLLDGTDFATSGSFDFSGSTDLSGTLGLVVGALLDADAGDTFRILDATSLNGTQFDSINFEATGAYEFDVIYGADFVDVEVLSVDPGPFNIFGDFDQDGDVDADDIDFYSGNVNFEFAQGEFAQLNQNSDGLITLADHDTHVFTLVETSNGQVGTFLGDFNLDGEVNVLGDAFTLIGNLGNENAGWADGDVNADGRVDILVDAFALVANLGSSNNPSSSVSTSAVPEPGMLPALMIAAAGVVSRRRKIS